LKRRMTLSPDIERKYSAIGAKCKSRRHDWRKNLTPTQQQQRYITLF